MEKMGKTGKGMACVLFFKVEGKETLSNVWPNRNMSAILERLDVC
jgi:hypothetical protein